MSLKDEAKALQKESKAQREEAEKMEESHRALQQRFATVQNDASKLAREKSSLQSEVVDLKRRLAAAERGVEMHESAAKGGEDMQREVDRLEDLLQEEKEANQKRVADTPQFTQMRKLLQTRNDKIKELRYITHTISPYLCPDIYGAEHLT
jgi:predicted RNase H-like nuclease (RuvC/YqgF family)